MAGDFFSFKKTFNRLKLRFKDKDGKINHARLMVAH
jgi:hypothetical protein